MIASIWRGVTQSSLAERYLEYLNQCVVPRLQTAPGNQGIFVLRDIQGELAYFLILAFWESTEALIEFAGEGFEYAIQHPEDEEYLLAFESVISQYQVVSVGDRTE
jgi:heme-degrading monooxygenase HmoA